MIVLAFLAVGFGCFAVGAFVAVLCLSAQEGDYQDALDALRRVRGA